MRTNKEIVDQTNELARIIIGAMGFDIEEDYLFYMSKNTRSQKAWFTACEAQELLTSTDVSEALDEMLDDEHADKIPENTLIKQDKEMNIDWNSKEAEGFNFILAHEDTSVRNEYCKEEPRENPNSYHANGVTFHKPKWTLHTRPKAKEMIYTKQMQEAGELPKVGMKVSLDSNKEVIVVGKKTNGGFVFEYKSGSIDAFSDDVGNKRLTYIDTRTDTEKAIDDLDLLSDNLRKGIVDNNSVSILSAIIKGKIHGVTFTGDK